MSDGYPIVGWLLGAFQADDEGSNSLHPLQLFQVFSQKRRSQKWAWERAGNDPTAGASRRVTARPLGFSSIGASLTKARLRHLATVLWFSPYRAASS